MEDIKNKELSFLRGGHYEYSNGNLDYRGSDGRYWDRRFYSGTRAYYLNFDSGNLTPQYHRNKGYGMPIRCVVR